MNRAVLLACAIVGLTALAAAAPAPGRVRFVYNASDSVSPGWYRITPVSSLRVGNIVLAHLPRDAAALAAERGYLPAGLPILKRVGATSPQRVCIAGRLVDIDGTTVAAAKTVDGLGRPLPLWKQCRALSDGELFLLSATNPASFDSRYFGPIDATAVIGQAQPLWTWRGR